MNANPIAIIDDDDDDLDLIREAFNEMQVQNEIIVFNDSHNLFSL